MIDLKNKTENFWEDCHKLENKNSICGFFENGKYYTTYKKTIDFLQLNKYIKPDLKILEIGVGLCEVTKELKKRGLNVSGLDISKTALKKAKTYCEKIYMLDEVNTLPSNYFDIIICNRVIQHISTNILINELKYCIQSLKKDGIFALQFVSNNTIEDSGINPTIKDIKSGTCCRSPEYLEKIINKFNAICTKVYSDNIHSGKVHACHVFHIRRL